MLSSGLIIQILLRDVAGKVLDSRVGIPTHVECSLQIFHTCQEVLAEHGLHIGSLDQIGLVMVKLVSYFSRPLVIRFWKA